MKALIVLWLFFAMSLPLAAQVGEAPATLHIYSRLVSLDVVVTDKNGHIVPDLKREDFEIFENKKLQTIKNFEAVESHKLSQTGGMIVRSSADLGKIGASSVTILVLDEMLAKFTDVGYSKECVEKFLKAQPDVLPQPTLLLVVRSNKFMVLHDYTQDSKELMKTIRSYKPVNPQISDMGGGNGRHIIMTLGAIEQIAKSQLGLPGRKNLIWIGKGFPTVDPVGGGVAAQALESFQDTFKMTTDLMLRTRMVLTVMDPAGLGGGGAAPMSAQPGDSSEMAASFDNSDTTPDQGPLSFGNLAELTGGQFLYNRNDLDQEIASTLERGRNYYTVSYIPTNDGATSGQYRHIRVLLKRPGLYVTTRQGYYPPELLAPSDTHVTDAQIAKTDQQERMADLANAASNKLAYDAVHIEMTKEAAPGEYEVYVRAADLSWNLQDDGAFAADVSLFLASFSSSGKATGENYVAIRKKLQQPPQAQDKAEVVYKLTFHAPENSVKLRFVLRDESSKKLGTADLKLP